LATTDAPPYHEAITSLTHKDYTIILKILFVTDDTEYLDLFSNDRNIGFTSDQERFSLTQEDGQKLAVNGGIVHG